MPPLKPANIALTGRDSLFRVMLATVVVAQLVAFWMVCRQQVSNAQAREAVVRVESMAMADCLRNVRRSTPDSCATRIAIEREANTLLAAGGERDAFPVRASMSSAVPLSFTLR
jgi:hypothetical protein